MRFALQRKMLQCGHVYVVTTYPPEVHHGRHAAEVVLGVFKLRVEEELAHHLRVVVHRRARHAERHCNRIQCNMTSQCVLYVHILYR